MLPAWWPSSPGACHGVPLWQAGLAFAALVKPGRTLTCPGLVRPLLVEIKFRPGAKGPALSLGGEKLR